MKVTNKKIEKRKITTYEVINMYEKALKKTESRGKPLYFAIIALFVLADCANYFSLFENGFDSNIIVYFVLSFSLALILDQASDAITKYWFTEKKHITDTNRRIIKIIISLTISAMILLLFTLLILRLQTTNLSGFDENMKTDAQKSFAFFMALIALSTSIASFLYSAVNTTILTPIIEKRINRKYRNFFKQLMNQAVEKKKELELNYSASENEIDEDHKAKERVIKALNDLEKSVNNEIKEVIR